MLCRGLVKQLLHEISVLGKEHRIGNKWTKFNVIHSNKMQRKRHKKENPHTCVIVSVYENGD